MIRKRGTGAIFRYCLSTATGRLFQADEDGGKAGEVWLRNSAAAVRICGIASIDQQRDLFTLDARGSRRLHGFGHGVVNAGKTIDEIATADLPRHSIRSIVAAANRQENQRRTKG